MKTRITALASTLALVALVGIAGCAPQEPAPTADTRTAPAAQEGSVIANHEALGTDLSALTEVSVASCTGSGCHGGSYEAVRESTEDIWPGIGQITAANPHEGHGSSGYTCANCHTLEDGPSINQCNACHIFESPQGWEDKPADTTQYGVVAQEALY